MSSNNPHHRPELHITVDHGVLEAPAGALFTGEQWHVFFQYRPDYAERKNNLGHVVSHDSPFFWNARPDVLHTESDELQIRAGSVVAPRDASTAELFFTSVTEAGPSVHVASISGLQTFAPRVRRRGSVVTGRDQFRSPCVVPGWADEQDRAEGHGGWLMLAVAGSMKRPVLNLLSSQEHNEWSVNGPLLFVGDTGLDEHSVLVSPRIMRLRDEVDQQVYDIVMVTIETHGVDVSGYLVGTLQGREFHVTTPFTRMDVGHDFTRPRNINTPPGVVVGGGQRYDSALVFGLMNGIGRLDDLTQHESLRTEGWANCLSLPRLTTLQNGLLFQTPPPGIITAVAESERTRLWTGLIDAQHGSIVVNLMDSTGTVAAQITHTGDHLKLDRSMNPHHKGDHPAEAELIAADTDSLTIIVDGSTVEVFADGGVVAMASRVYFSGTCSGFEVRIRGDAHLLRYFEVNGRTAD